MESLELPVPVAALARRSGREARFRAGQFLFRAGDPVAGLHLLVSGSVRVVRSAPDRAVVVHREGAGGLLGEVAFFSNGRYPGSAVALEPAVTLLLPGPAVHAALRSDPGLAQVLLERLASRTRDVIDRLDRITHFTVGRRLALHLLERAARAERAIVTLGMTQVQLAEELGTVKEVITRELRVLVRLGVLEPRGGGRYAVRSLAGLRDLAGAREGS